MLGVVRVYSRKVGYLYQDTNEALLKIQQVINVLLLLLLLLLYTSRQQSAV
jgi:hypothetical protein